KERAKTGDFQEFLVDDKGKPIPPSFEVPEKYKEHTPAGELLREMKDEPPDEFTKLFNEELKKDMEDQAPDTGAIIGYALATLHQKGQPDQFLAPPGTKVGLVFPRFGETKSEAGFDTATTIGYFKSGMSEYDSTHVYVSLEALQKTRLLYDYERKTG